MNQAKESGVQFLDGESSQLVKQVANRCETTYKLWLQFVRAVELAQSLWHRKMLFWRKRPNYLPWQKGSVPGSLEIKIMQLWRRKLELSLCCLLISRVRGISCLPQGHHRN